MQEACLNYNLELVKGVKGWHKTKKVAKGAVLLIKINSLR